MRFSIYESRVGLDSFSRDPIGYEDSENLYRLNIGLSNVDPSGEITVTSTLGIGGSLSPVCGKKKAGVFFTFQLDKPATCDGYIVQMNEIRCTRKKCKPDASGCGK